MEDEEATRESALMGKSQFVSAWNPSTLCGPSPRTFIQASMEIIGRWMGRIPVMGKIPTANPYGNEHGSYDRRVIECHVARSSSKPCSCNKTES
eukprot:3355670-Amphidinium_carterae.1